MKAALAAAAATAFVWLLVRAESQAAIGALLLLAVVAGVVVARFGARGVSGQYAPHLAVAGVIVLALLLRDDDFSLLLLCRVLIVIVACLGLNVQFGNAGVMNFAGASFFGVGGYTAAVLAPRLPHVVVLLMGGLAAAAVGTVLLIPVVRTRGHYAALVTIAFALLFRTFLEVNDSLGGPQGLKLGELRIGPLRFNDPIEIGSFEGSFYLRYIALALLLVAIFFTLARRIEQSFAGITLDAVRLDEVAAAAFGVNVARWKMVAFTLGNFVIGVAGALSAFMIGFIAPNNYAFGESLILVSVLLLGGLGNPWGLSLASAIIILLPEKLQAIQEYRFLLFASIVILILIFKPAGLLPRPLRRLGR